MRPRQKTQAIVKQACQKAGIEVELKSVVASVFFSSDTANPDTYPHFYCDAQMYNTTMPQPDPQFFMNQFVSWEVATKDNKWQGRNVSRWQNKEYDEIYKQAEQRARRGEARGDVHQAQRPRRVRTTISSRIVYRPRATALKNGKLTAHHQRLGQRSLAARQLVPGGADGLRDAISHDPPTA